MGVGDQIKLQKHKHTGRPFCTFSEWTVYSLNRQILYDVEINVFALHKSGLLC